LGPNWSHRFGSRSRGFHRAERRRSRSCPVTCSPRRRSARSRQGTLSVQGKRPIRIGAPTTHTRPQGGWTQSDAYVSTPPWWLRQRPSEKDVLDAVRVAVDEIQCPRSECDIGPVG